VLAATMGDEIVGGLTAHTLPMTRSESREIFIYDIAVRASHQRRGVGRLLMSHLARLAGEAGIADMFVPADDEDSHALEFYRALGGVASPVTFFTFGRASASADG
jgi:aminoglycoside 3-N-acetyltransferase I